MSTNVQIFSNCREYVIIHPNNPENQNLIRFFEVNHKGHTLITLDLNEVKDQYKTLKDKNCESIRNISIMTIIDKILNYVRVISKEEAYY